MVIRITVASLLFSLFLGNLAKGQATAPVTQALKATVQRVVGIAQARKSENDKWQRVEVGQVYEEGVEFRTGPRSMVAFHVPPDQTIILDRLGTVKLLIAQGGGNQVRTSLGMQYGRTEYQVEEAGLQHDAAIAAPGATLAVRGTKNMLLYDQGPFTPVALASQPVRLRNDKGRTVAFGKAGARARIAADKNSPGDQSLVQSRVDPAGAFAARTEQENAVLSYMQRVAPNLNIANFGVFSRLNDPNSNIIGVLPLPGQLQFTLIWNTSIFSNLDLAVTSPRGEVVSFKNPRVKSSGRHFGDEASVKGFGQETVLWEKGFPDGKYRITISVKGSKGASAYDLFVIKDPGKKTGGTVGTFSGNIDFQNSPQDHIINVTSKTQPLPPARTTGRR